MNRPGEALLSAGITPFPPGAFFRERFLAPRNVGAADAASDMHMPISELELFMAGQTPVDGPLARRLAAYTGTSSQFWLNMQEATDRADAAPYTASR